LRNCHAGVLAQQGSISLARRQASDRVRRAVRRRGPFFDERFRIAGVERRQQTFVFCIETATGFVAQGINTTIELTQRNYVAERGTLLDQVAEQCMRGRYLLLDPPALCSYVSRRALYCVSLSGDAIFSMMIRRTEAPVQASEYWLVPGVRKPECSFGQLFDARADLHHQNHGQDRSNAIKTISVTAIPMIFRLIDSLITANHLLKLRSSNLIEIWLRRYPLSPSIDSGGLAHCCVQFRPRRLIRCLKFW